MSGGPIRLRLPHPFVLLLSAKVAYGRWFRFAAPGTLLVGVVGAIGVLIAA